MSLKNRNKFMSLDGMNDLRAAVVYQACLDYLTGEPIPKDKKYSKEEIELRKKKNRGMIKRWMHGEAFSFWCDVDPDTILRRLDKMMAEGQTKLYNLYEEEGQHIIKSSQK